LNILLEFECDLKKLNQFSQEIAQKIQLGDIFFLLGDLGVGKTTFARLLINSLFDKAKVNRPDKILSPSYPIMINYPLPNYEIFHYDFYRIKNKNELVEIDFFENLDKNLSIIEWPDLVLNNFSLTNYYLIEFGFVDIKKRYLKVQHSKKLKFYE
tara:strand:- start:134 stop:598 length:465 start_codon:yes stop_codon:yes gene_type:complete